jgi:segregation and condensation protein A
MSARSDNTARLEMGSEDQIPASERLASETLIVALDGFEGPLDLMLALARTQKLDISKISILSLARQYLDFISVARALRLEVAADYLVMAAWLAYLKSKLLLPAEEKQDDGPTGQELAAHLAFRLQRLEAMRDVMARIMNRKQLGVDIFPRGMPEGIRTVRASEFQASVYDLLTAYANQRKKAAAQVVQWGGRTVWSIKDARNRLERLLGQTLDPDADDWAQIDQYLTEFVLEPEVNRTAWASTFGAMLELTREGFVEIRQSEPFGPIYIRWLKKPSEQAIPAKQDPPNQDPPNQDPPNQDPPSAEQETEDEEQSPRIVATG